MSAAGKTLKIWNGRGYGVFPQERRRHLYIAAYSKADARRLCVEVGGQDPGQTEVDKYWAANCWGIRMYGITPERGIWLANDQINEAPRRITNYGGGK